MYKLKLAVAFASLFISLFSGVSYSAPGDPGNILTTLSINNISGDGRTPSTPHGVTMHDGYLWVVDFGTDRIYRVYPEDVYDEEGALQFSAGDSDLNLPLTDTDNPPINSDGNPIPTCGATPAGQYCGGGGLTFAENYLWNASPITDNIIKIDPVDGDNLESENALSELEFPSPTDMTYDGHSFWIVDWQTNTINKVRPEDGALLLSLPGPSTLPSYQSNPSVTNARPFGITWDGRDLWVADQQEQKIFRVDPTDGSVVGFFETPGSNPKGLSWDGELIWHADQTTGLIYAIETGVIPFGITGCIEKNGVAIEADLLLSQTAQSDITTSTDVDGCFQFTNFVAGSPIQLQANESGVDLKPVITLSETSPGSTDVTLLVGDTYAEPGFVAIDPEDGDISVDVITRPNVLDTPSIIDTSTPNNSGIQIEYDVVDSQGNNATTVIRTVYVIEEDTTAPVITLIGDDPTYVEQLSTYNEEGATAIDNRDGDISAKIMISGNVDSDTAGTYTLAYDVTDEAGNVATTVTREVIVQDTTAPVITLIGDAVVTLERGDSFSDEGASAVDNVDGDISASIVSSGSVISGSVGSYIINYNVSDTAGNSAIVVSRTVNVVDTTAPIITLLGAAPYNQEINTPFNDPGATAIDVPGEDLSSSIVVTGTVNTSVEGTYTLSYDVSDASGNVATSIFRDVIVADSGSPMITLLGDNPLTHAQGSPYTDPGATATDAVDGDLSGSIVVGGDTVDPNLIGSYLITYDVSDSSGNPAPTVTRTVNIDDSTAPVITLIGDTNTNHQLGTAYVDAGATALDNIDGDISSNIVVSGDTVDGNTQGTYTVIYNVTDSSGNAANPMVRFVTVDDVTPPVITLVGNNPINHEVNTIYTDPGATATDNTDGDISANIGVSGTVNATVIGSYVLSYNVNDSSGNSATTVTRTINVQDTGAPSITLLGSSPLNHELNTPYTDAGATASDALDGDISTNIIVGGATVDSSVTGTYVITYDVSDSNGNPAVQQTRTVNVNDFTAPVITLNGDSSINIALGSVYNDADASASDNIDGDISASIIQSGTVDTGTIGSYTLVYNVSDAAGNAAIPVTRTVNVADASGPVITLIGTNPINHEVNTIFTDPGATALDNVDGDVSSNIGVSGTVNAAVVGSYVLSYNVNDSSGNSATTVTRTINVQDTGAPSITLLGSSPLNHELNTPYTDAGATANDALDGDLSAGIIVGGTMVDSSVAGTYVITYDVSDSNGNPAVQQTRTVNVNDFTAPVITLNGDSSINIALGSVYNDAGASASDNIDGDISASIIQSGAVDTGTIGSYTLVYNVSDAAGNDAMPVTRTVNVADASGPVITLIGNNPIDHEVNTIFTDPGATALDNVDGDVSSNIGVSGTVNAAVVGSYVLSYNVNDSSGNPANTVNRTVNVQDTGAPSITVLGSSPLNHELNTPYTDAGATANDALDGDLSAGIIVGGTMVDSSVAGTYIITYDVSDSNGNPAPQQTRTVNVNDFTDPVITLIGDSFVSVDIDSIYTDAGASASDNIDGDISSNIIPSGFVDTSTPGSYTLNYDVSDAAGNAAATVSRTVNVSDSSGPTITLIGGDTIEHQQGTIFNDPGASAFDAVDGDVSSNISITGFVNASVAGSYALTYNVSDSQGNPATPVTRTVNVADSLPPVITLIGDNPLHVELNGSFTELGATASDSVDGDLSSAIIISGDAVNTSIAGTYITRYNVSDNTGNSAIEVTRTVLVSDTTIPVISLLGSNPMSIALGSIFSDPGATASDNIDGNISTSIIPSGSVDPTTLGSYTLSYDVSDSAGNAALTVTRVVNVEDNSAPLISLLGDNPMDISLGGSYNEAGATATDNVDGDLTSSIAINGSVDTDTPGTYTISYSVSDSEGNVGNATRQVNVIDNTSSDTVPPVISLLGNNPILIELGGTYFEPGATAVDGVDGDLSASIAISGFVATNAVGSYQVTYNVSDLSGNAALTVTRTVIVQDTTAPVISLLGSDPSYHEQGTTYIDAGATASDFGSDISSSIFVSGDVNENIAGTYTLSYDVADAQGNDATTVTRTVHVVDTTPPSISVLGDNPVEVIQGHVYSDLGVSATDNIDGDISSNVSIDTSGLDMSTPGSYQVHFNVTDAAGNSALTQTRTVTVIPLVKTFSASPGLDAGSSSNSTSMTISDDRQLADLNVMIDISHGRPGDLILTLTSPAGTSVVIMDRPGTTGGWFDFGCANDDVDATFDDQGSSAVENVCNSSPGIGGTVIPHNALSAFNGESTQGVWTLKVEDKATITNSGTLNTWALETIIQ